MFDLKKLCYFLVAINVIVILFNVTFIRNVEPQQEMDVMGSSENKVPNIDIDVSKSTLKSKPIDKDAPYISVDFEITGKVQGVYFRKHTEQKATELGLVGWVMNTPSGSVEGLMQGPPAKIQEMREWLCETGSPSSEIKDCNFTNEEGKESLTYKKFIVMK